jgi:hypothetical protein
MYKIKCPFCLGCMDLVYTPQMEQVWHCWLCKTWYVNELENGLRKVENPLLENIDNKPNS